MAKASPAILGIHHIYLSSTLNWRKSCSSSAQHPPLPLPPSTWCLLSARYGWFIWRHTTRLDMFHEHDFSSQQGRALRVLPHSMSDISSPTCSLRAYSFPLAQWWCYCIFLDGSLSDDTVKSLQHPAPAWLLLNMSKRIFRQIHSDSQRSQLWVTGRFQ